MRVSAKRKVVIMTVYQLVFSPTGGTRKVAARLAAAFGESVFIDLCRPKFTLPKFQPTKDDIVIVAVPSFGGRVPLTAVERLSALNGCGARAILAAVYGNRATDDTLLELYDALTAANFRCCAAVEAIAEHSIARQFAAGRPDADDCSVLEEYSAQLKAALAEDKGEYSLALPGNRPYKERKPSASKPLVNEKCVHCGACAERCPVDAIPSDKPDTTDFDQCISCMRCIAVCPVKARHLDPQLLAGIGAKLAPACTEPKENKLYL